MMLVLGPVMVFLSISVVLLLLGLGDIPVIIPIAIVVVWVIFQVRSATETTSSPSKPPTTLRHDAGMPLPSDKVHESVVTRQKQPLGYDPGPLLPGDKFPKGACYDRHSYLCLNGRHPIDGDYWDCEPGCEEPWLT